MTTPKMVPIVLIHILAAFLFVGASAGRVNYNDCGSSANVTDIDVTECTKQPCIFNKGHTYTIKISAIGAYETRSLPYKVTAKIFLVPVTLLKGNACDELFEGKCPVEKGLEFAYEHNISIKDKFPSVKTKVTAHVVDDKGNTVVCVELAVKIK